MQMDAFGPDDERRVATENKIALLVSKEIQEDENASNALPIATESEIWESAKQIDTVRVTKEQHLADDRDVLIRI